MSKAFVTVLRGDVGGAPQSIPDVTWTTVLYDIVQTDGQHVNMYNATTLPLTGLFTIPLSGWYDFEAEISWSDVTGTIRAARILVNQDPLFPVFVGQWDDDQITNRIRHRLMLAQGQTLQIQIFQESGGGALDLAATLDPGTIGQPGHATNGMLTLVKECPNNPPCF
uniref:C1q domain protein n=1 Tax=Marseillevirus LCMAC101 TaxID=2506602 RepID=A0A481YRL7_9VIRU|nr:MAG: C1q domain protein [Marseillevirus LCMAC101]